MNKVIVRRLAPAKVWDEQASLHPLLKTIYALRGISSLVELERGLEQLIPYQQLKGINGAVDCLQTALLAQEHILIVGDFDADGATSSALAVSALKSLGAQHVSYLVPNRFTYGYGLTPEIVAVAAQRQPKLIITVDNGISSISGVKAAKDLGIKVLITDHHLPGAELPEADAIVNPNQPSDEFPSKHMAGVGVIFYVMLALRSRLRESNWFSQIGLEQPNMGQFLDLVALGTVADVVPLDKNNRILIHQGLQRIRNSKVRPGIQAMLDVAGRHNKNLTAADLGFALGPRLNAAGRLDDMSLGIECLLSSDPNKARDMAVQLDRLNKERQSIEVDMQQQAVAALANLHFTQDVPLGICLHDDTWHQGVIGIVASRIKDRYHRPVIAFASANEHELKGSARSVTGVHIRDVLDVIATRHPGLIDKFGGHAMAAGLTLPRQHLASFRSAFAEEVGRYLTLEDLQGKIHSDGELAPEHFCLEVARLLCEGGPWGQAFPEPLFDNIFKLIDQRLVGSKHLKMVLELQSTSQLIDAIAFNINVDEWPNQRCKQIHAAYRLDINEFRGVSRLQLVIEHLQAIN